jgi:NhaP-type Na+/H+ or K+/H+ antiporter
MKGAIWFLVVGVLLVAMALSRSVLARLPLSTAMLYLAAGFALGPYGAGLLHVDVYEQSAVWERVTEIAILVSLFAAGLKLRAPLLDGRWVLPVRLATLSMTITVGLVTLLGVFAMGLPVGAAVLLGAILAPTDPVLASDVQVTHAADRDRLRFGLTGEAGLNDGTAFPFVMLGLGLLGLHEIGEMGWRWFAVDLAWAVVSGLAVGAVLGTMVGRLVLHLRRVHREAVGLDDFLALGLIALAYGVALLVHGYGFLAVFAAGLALRRIERTESGGEAPPEDVAAAAHSADAEELATDKETAPAYMAQAALGFTEQLERIGEFTVVLLLGGMISWHFLPAVALWFIPSSSSSSARSRCTQGCWDRAAPPAARDDRVVRHPRDRLRVLPHLRHAARPPRGAEPPACRAGPSHRGRLRGGPRHLRHAADGAVQPPHEKLRAASHTETLSSALSASSVSPCEAVVPRCRRR